MTTLGADVEVFADDLSQPGGWGLVDDEGASIANVDGALEVTIRQDGNARWTWHVVPEPSSALRLEVDAEIGAAGTSAGPMCGTRGDSPEFAFGVVNTADSWVVGRVIANQVSVITRGSLEGTDLTEGGRVRLAIECAVTDDGDRVAFWVNDRLVADVTGSEPRDSFDKAGLYVDATTAPGEVRFDDARVLTGPPAAPETSPAPTGPVTSLGATVVELQDGFEDETVWGTGANDRYSIAYDEGRLRITIRARDSGSWSLQTFENSAPVLRMESTVKVSDARGHAGVMCGAPGDDPSYYFAGLSDRDRVVFGTVVSGVLSELSQEPFPAGVEAAADHRLALECAVTGDGVDRVAAWVDGLLAVDHLSTASLGAFDKVALYAHGTARRFSAAFDDVVITSGAAYAPVLAGSEVTPPPGTPAPTADIAPTPAPTPAPTATSPAATPIAPDDLLLHVPDSFRDDCRTVEPDGAGGQLAAILCVPAGTAASAEYYLYDSAERLAQAFDTFVTLNAVDRAGTDCTAASALVDYTIGDVTAGQLACFDGPGGDGVTYLWSDPDLGVIAFGLGQDGDYADMYTWWQDAGPLP